MGDEFKLIIAVIVLIILVYLSRDRGEQHTTPILTFSKKELKIQYRDPRWIKRSKEIKDRDNWTCQKCYKKNCSLEVHHTLYENGRYVWEYPDKYLISYCPTCHDKYGSYTIGIVEA